MSCSVNFGTTHCGGQPRVDGSVINQHKNGQYMTITAENVAASEDGYDLGDDELDISYYIMRNGGDYCTLLAAFQEVVDLGPIPDTGKSFLAPPASCSFSYH